MSEIEDAGIHKVSDAAKIEAYIIINSADVISDPSAETVAAQGSTSGVALYIGCRIEAGCQEVDQDLSEDSTSKAFFYTVK